MNKVAFPAIWAHRAHLKPGSANIFAVIESTLLWVGQSEEGLCFAWALKTGAYE